MSSILTLLSFEVFILDVWRSEQLTQKCLRERCIREDINSFLVSEPNPIQLAYHHVHLLALRLDVAQTDYDHIQHVRKLHDHVLRTTAMLNTANGTRSPLFAALAPA